jgi:anti-sigma factor ChrR (cupin superfamily)
MIINADFSERVVVRPDEAKWTPSPHRGVDRLMLDRIGDEIARATSFVRFAPGSAFPHHTHSGGEEVYVMEGVFEDENGVHAAGSYLRDPTGSSHAPFSPQGCVLFVKLRQFDKNDKDRVDIDTASGDWRTAPEGFAVQPLHHFDGVTTFLVRLEPGTTLSRAIHPDGEEMVVIAGACSDAQGAYPAGAWIRDPGGHAQGLFSALGCTLLVKTGHLAAGQPPACDHAKAATD